MVRTINPALKGASPAAEAPRTHARTHARTGFTVCVLVAAGLLVPLAHELARVTQKALGLGESRTVALQSPS